MWASGGGTSARIFRRIGRSPHGRAGAARIQAVEPDPAGMLVLVGEYLHQALHGELGRAVGAPVGPALAAHTRRGQHHRGRLRLLQQRQHRLRQQEGAVHVHLEDPLPLVRRVVGDVDLGAEQRGVVQQTVQTAEALADGIGECGRVLVAERGEITGHDHGLRVRMPVDPVENGFELAARAAEENDAGAECGIGHGRRAADPVTGTGDQDHLARQTVGFRRMAPGGTRRGEFGIVIHAQGFRACSR